MKKNEGKIDRIIRVIAGLGLLTAAYITQQYWLAIGIVPLATGLIGFCPAYRIFGISTCSIEQNS